MKLTKSAIERLPVPAAGYAIYRDDSLPGFAVRVTASGARSFILERRVKRKVRRMTIGRFGDLTAEQARKEAQRLAGHIAVGRDPAAERRIHEAETVPLETALAEYLERRHLKTKTVSDIHNAMLQFQDWMQKPLKDISADMVVRRHRLLGERSHARANLAMRYLRAVFNFAIAEYAGADGTPVLTHNPVTHLSRTRAWYRVNRRQTLIKPHQLEPWLRKVLSLPNRTISDYFQFILLTGLRREEAANLRWTDCDIEARAITIADTKAHRTHTLPLSDFLFEMLERRKAVTKGDYVFADLQGRKVSNLRYAQERVENLSGVSFCIHDLRRTFATIAESIDIPSYALKRLLNHAAGSDVTQGYLIVDVERLRSPMQRITDYVLRAGKLKESAEIIPIGTEKSKAS